MRERFKIEHYVFAFCILYSLAPLFSDEYFVTLDGAAHLYNAKIIESLLFDGNTSPYREYLELNSTPVPNWSGHFFMMLFGMIFSPSTAEKLVMVIYAVGLPLAFRYFLSAIKANKTYALLILPLVFSNPFALGFFNFCIGLVFFFLNIGWNFKQVDAAASNWRSHFITLLLFTGLYFSHFFLFAFALMVIGIYRFYFWFSSDRNGKRLLQQAVNMLPVLPFLILGFQFYLSESGDQNYIYLSTQELWEKLISGSSIIAWTQDENTYTGLMVYCLAACSIYLIYQLVLTTKDEKKKTPIAQHIIFGFGVLLLILYFILPDANQRVGFMSTRTQLLFIMIWIAIIASFSSKKRVLYLSIMVFFYAGYQLNHRYEKLNPSHSDRVYDLEKIESKMSAGSTVLTIDCLAPEMYFFAHTYSYIGISKDLVILNNYEAYMGYFPVVWTVHPYNFNRYQVALNEACDYTLEVIMEGEIDPDYILLNDIPFLKEECTNDNKWDLSNSSYQLAAESKYYTLLQKTN